MKLGFGLYRYMLDEGTTALRSAWKVSDMKIRLFGRRI